MKKIVQSIQEQCVGCNRCTRECPIETANLTYLDEDNNIKVKVENTKCIACGTCIAVCKHEARYYMDDMDAFFMDLKKGVPISLIVAPSIKTNFPQWKRLFTYLRHQGIQKIYDVSLGADICIWAHLRFIEQNKPKSLITQPCPAIVSYCEIHRPELLPSLSPIHSPMCCTVVHMKEYEGITDKIAALSPCIAKANEFEATDMIEYNITYSKLWDYISRNNIELPLEETEFDHYDSGLGTLFPSPGGLKENIEYFMGKTLRVDKAEGRNVYKKLDLYAKTSTELLPQIFDVLNCAEGCNMGSGCLHQQNDFEIQSIMDVSRRKVTDNHDLPFFKERYLMYDKAYVLSKFMRQYRYIHTVSTPLSEADIQEAFLLLDKSTYASQNVNCGACGSETCRNMARKIALKLNIPLNCIIKSRDDTKEEHKKNVERYRRNLEFIELVHDVGENLLSMEENEFSGIVQNAIDKLCVTLKANGVYIWRNFFDGSGRLYCKIIYGCPETTTDIRKNVYADTLPQWFDELSAGKPVNQCKASLSKEEMELFSNQDAFAVLAAPILIKGEFWGIIIAHREFESPFDTEEVSVIVASSALIVSSIIEKELTDNLIDAREKALSGARAKSEFLARVSHELRTPMNAVKGLSELLTMTQMSSLQRNYVNNIIVSANSLLGIINDILDFTKIDSNKLQLVEAPYSLAGLISGACNVVNVRAGEKNLLLLIDASPDLPTSLIGDDMRIKQIVINLLSNSVKYTKEGYVLLKICAEEKDGKTWLVCSVEDSGIGIREQDLSLLFQEFSRVDLVANRTITGTGLGLAISKQLAIAMGGDIEVESIYEKGSVFTLRIPQKVEDASPIAQVLHPESKKVLLLGVKRMKNLSGMLDLLGVSHAHMGTAEALDNMDIFEFTHCICDGSFSEEAVRSLRGRSADCLFAEIKSINHSMAVSDYQDAVFFHPVFIVELARFLNREGHDTKNQSMPELASKGVTLKGVKVLVVDDNEINLIVSGEILRTFHAEVVCVDSGDHAIDLCKNTKYDLIFMDHMMPGKDGVETTVELRSMENLNQETPIIALTANVVSGMESIYFNSGMNDIISKPIEFPDLRRVLCKWLPKEKISIELNE